MAAGTVLTGKFSTIKRSDGTTQPTYMGHPLYLFAGDSGPGQVNGNKLNNFGALWYAMTPSGAKITKTATGGASGGGGY